MSDYKPNPGDEVLLTVGATVDEDGDYRVMIPVESGARASSMLFDRRSRAIVSVEPVLHVPSDIWVAMYGWARYGNWEIPALGLHPDRWPVIEPEHAFTPPSLTVVAGDGDGGVGLPRPSLQVVGGA